MILASDYDGTLKQNNEVSMQDIEAIHKFRDAGHHFGIVTGRSLKMILPELEERKIPFDFLIGNNGGILADRQGNIISRKDIQLQDALELIEDLKAASIKMFGISDGSDFGTIHPKSKGTNKFNQYASDPGVLLKKGIINSFYFRHYSDEETLALYRVLSEKYKGRIAFHYNNGTIDASAAFVDKAGGIQMLEKTANEKPFVIGDGHNDLPMIRTYHGFSLVHAPQEVQNEASFVFHHVKECVEHLLED